MTKILPTTVKSCSKCPYHYKQEANEYWDDHFCGILGYSYSDESTLFLKCPLPDDPNTKYDVPPCLDCGHDENEIGIWANNGGFQIRCQECGKLGKRCKTKEEVLIDWRENESY